MTDHQYKLPLTPYLDNCTEWWIIENLGYEYLFNKLPINDYKDVYKKYQQWMTDQGVIIKKLQQNVIEEVHEIHFVDEQSMLIFLMKWGN